MADTVRIQMMSSFMIYINEQQRDQLVNRSRKGAALLQYLILNRGRPVQNNRLLDALWNDETSANPENALKTLVSRMRTLLNQLSPGLGQCIAADRGAYHFQLLPGMTVDLYEIEDILSRLLTAHDSSAETARLYDRLLSLYTGDLLQQNEAGAWALSQVSTLHDQYMAAVYAYVDLLKGEENYEKIAQICRVALDVDTFDDRLHMELMTALIQTDRTADALVQYKHVMHLNYRYLGVQPSSDMQEFYKQIVQAGKTLEFNLESIRNELRESCEQRGAFVCEYAVFKELYNLQIRNLERLGSTMFLGVIMVGNPDAPLDNLKQDNVMNGLLEIMRQNLRKGDVITQLSPTTFALLLPTVNFTTGSIVMERIKYLFYRKYPNSDIPFHYRVGPLSTQPSDPAPRENRKS